MRIPALEIEAAVINMLASALHDPLALLTSAGLPLESDRLPALLAAAKSTASLVRRRHHKVIRSLITRVTVTARQVSITIPVPALCNALGIDANPTAKVELDLTEPMRLSDHRAQREGQRFLGVPDSRPALPRAATYRSDPRGNATSIGQCHLAAKRRAADLLRRAERDVQALTNSISRHNTRALRRRRLAICLLAEAHAIMGSVLRNRVLEKNRAFWQERLNVAVSTHRNAPPKWARVTAWEVILSFNIDALNAWRSGRDSNPRYGVTVYTLSRRAPSTTRPPLRLPDPKGKRALTPV